MVERLYFYKLDLLLDSQDDNEDMQYLKIYSLFTAVKTLYMYKSSALCIAPTLKLLVGERAIGVFPALENLFLERGWPRDPVQDSHDIQHNIGEFIAAREVLGHPVAIYHWSMPYIYDFS
jgi:hypothetical protein